MINNNKFIVYDFETDGIDPHTCSPTQLAAVAINPRNLSIIEGSEFNVRIKPSGFNRGEYVERVGKTIEFHAKCSGKTTAEIIDIWENGIEESVAWSSFTKYIESYKLKGGRTSPYPIQVGWNNLGYDDIIVQRLCDKYGPLDRNGKQALFLKRDKVDLLNIMFLFFENRDDMENYKLDTWRTYTGESGDRHDALGDVIATALTYIRFQQFIRKAAAKCVFKDCFKNV